MSCNDIPSISDLEKTKLRIDHFAELIDGTPSGTSTNPITGVTHPTYEKAIKDLGFKPGSGSFTTGFTINPGEYDVAWYDPTSKNWYSYDRAIPTGGLVVAPGTNPAAVGSGYVPHTDVVLRNDLAGAGGADMIGFQQAGSGSVYRSVQDKLGEVVSVKDFGATGDGNTNDTIAVQAAVNAASVANRDLYFPAGTYRINITLPATMTNYRRFGERGRTIIKPAVSTLPAISDCSNRSWSYARIDNIIFYGYTLGSQVGIAFMFGHL